MEPFVLPPLSSLLKLAMRSKLALCICVTTTDIFIIALFLTTLEYQIQHSLDMVVVHLMETSLETETKLIALSFY